MRLRIGPAGVRVMHRRLSESTTSEGRFLDTDQFGVTASCAMLPWCGILGVEMQATAVEKLLEAEASYSLKTPKMMTGIRDVRE